MEFYKNIEELPVYNFNKITETGNLSYLFVNGKLGNNADLIWDGIMKEFFDYVGISESYKAFMEHSRNAAILTCRMYLENRKDLINFIDIENLQAKESLSDVKEDFTKTVMIISKNMGFKVDPKTTTVKEFYSMVKIMSDGK